jgi:hypothetical protein
MISLELAKRLKAAGLRWEWPSSGDFIYNHMADRYGCVDEWIYTKKEVKRHWENGRVDFAPRLDQLLAGIEARGYRVWLKTKRNACVVRIRKVGEGWGKAHIADTPEEAAGRALLWILERSQNEPRD